MKRFCRSGAPFGTGRIVSFCQTLVAGISLAALSSSAGVSRAQEDDSEAGAGAGRAAAQVTDFLPEDVAPSVEAAKLTRSNQRKADALAAFIEGAVAESTAETDKALTHYREVLNVDPGAMVTSPNGDRILLAVKVAYELARRGEVSEGIGLLKDSIKAVPDDSIAYLYLAQLYARYLRKPELAQRYARKAQELDPFSLEPYQTLFEIHLAENQPDKAEKTLDEAAEVKSDDPEYWAGLGEMYRSFYQRDNGKTDASAAAKMDRVIGLSLKYGGDDPDIKAKAADYYILTDRVELAIPLYEAFVAANDQSSDPAVLDIRDKLGRSYLASGQRAKAIEEYRAITSLNPLRYESYEILGQIYQDAQEWDRALSAYQQSILLAPNQPMNYVRIAALQQKKEQFDKAVEDPPGGPEPFSDLSAYRLHAGPEFESRQAPH